MYYHDETLEEMSEGHKFAVQQKNKGPSKFYDHEHVFKCVHEQKIGGMTVKLNWCTVCGTIVKHYIDSEGHYVELFTEYPNYKNNKGEEQHSW